MTKNYCLLRILACLAPAAAAAGAHAQELIANGNFESAGLSPWELSAPAGSSVAIAAENSPFLTVYPAGTRSANCVDDDVEFETPYFKQSFAAQPGLRFSFDFKAGAAAPGSSWYVIWSGDEDTTAFFFSIGGQDGSSIELNQNRIAGLEAGLWYHVEGTADAPNQQIAGAVQNSRGERASFTGGFPFGVQRVIGALNVTDGDQARNAAIHFDNISAQPASVALASLSIVRKPDGQVTVSWTAAGYVLQTSPAVGPGAAWQNIETAEQSYTTAAGQPAQFFQLVSQ